MALYQLIIDYDGTHFLGFQRQARGRTVQGEIEKALLELGWKGSSILAAGRTDAGVHASGQVIAFELDWPHEPEKLQSALNARLAQDVVVKKTSIAEKGFHPRFDATQRTYHYRIYCSAQRNPLLERFAWQVWPKVEIARLNAAAGELIGKHDFCAFGRPLKDEAGTVRTVVQAQWRRSTPGWLFEITANAFLYHMVRRLVYVQVKYAQGFIDLAEIRNALRTGCRIKPGMAPACGLELAEVSYKK